ncbi:MAG: CDP-diacylglycerol--glycerol-3-phosphate 3-phosphatidyltransferase [Deltaproteobacteria bacterium]|nr:CDP-diacylglycerol--glycerol-3-phosphate 3-phosphatidyltransferase [Deltaproteobacteria bacterium]
MHWTLPNVITIARLGLLPFIVFLIWPGIENRETCFWAAVIYTIGGVLDVLDGILARRRNEVTVLGKFLDPLADKLFYLVTLIALMQLQEPRVPAWLVMIVLARELAITGLRGIAASDGIVIAAGGGGKMKTTLATVGMVGLLIHYPYFINFGPFSALIDMHYIGLWLTYISIAFSISSGIEYLVGFNKAMRARHSVITEKQDI